MTEDLRAYEIQAGAGIPVQLPSGATYYVLTDEEERYLTDKIKRYLSDNHFVNVSDVQDIDKMITFELLIHRWSSWVAKGRDYYDEDVNVKQYAEMVKEYSVEVRQLKKALGVDKSTRDRTRGDDSIASLWANLQRRAAEFGYKRNEEYVQVITSFQRIKAMVTFHDNCLAGETQVLTRRGVQTLMEIEDQPVDVLDGSGGWVPVVVRERGEQPVFLVRLERNQRVKSIRATEDHRWFARRRTANGSTRELTTTDLRAGDRLVTVVGKRRTLDPSPWGIAQGIVFGDGALDHRQRGTGTKVRLCGEKAELLKWFPLSATRSVDSDLEVVGLPRNWKDLPNSEMDTQFLLGWLAGYFATDGSVDVRGHAHLDSSTQANIIFARDLCVRLCIPTTGISTYTSSGYQPTVMWRLGFPGGALNDILLRSRHRDNAPAERGRVGDWKVVAVEPTGQTVPVFCPTVPTTHSFVLEGNILTGNCDALERKENACEVGDVLEVLRQELAKFDAIDEKFKYEKQTLWIRSQ